MSWYGVFGEPNAVLSYRRVSIMTAGGNSDCHQPAIAISMRVSTATLRATRAYFGPLILKSSAVLSK